MTKSYDISKYYDLGPMDLRKSLVNRDPNRAVSQTNMIKVGDDNLTIRPGTEIVLSNQYNAGPKTGIYGFLESDEILFSNSVMYELSLKSIAVFNSGSNTYGIAKTFSNIGSWTVEISSALVQNYYPLDVGLESSPIKVHQAASYIKQTTSNTVVAVPDPAINLLPAAWIPKMPGLSLLPGASVSIPYYKPEEISFQGGRHQHSSFSVSDNVAWKVRHAVVNETLYLGDYNNLKRYDGVNLAVAGLVAPPSLTLTPATSGGVVADGTYRYLVYYSVIDATGREHFSDPFVSDDVVVSGGGGSGKVTISGLNGGTGIEIQPPEVRSSTLKWGAVSTATQSGTTLSVDDGSGGPPRVDVGDTVYFLERGAGSYVTREVTAVTSTTITISGGSVSVNNNDPISPNIRIYLYRSKVGPSTLYYYLDCLPYSIDAGGQSYVDGISDALLTGAEYIFPAVSHAPMPAPDVPIYAMGRYRNSLILCGVINNSSILFSDVDSPEYFPAENVISFNTFDKTEPTGVSERSDHFLVFKKNSCAIVSGELTTGQYVVDTFSHEIGCCSCFSIREIGGYTYWVSKDGVHRQRPGGAIELISDLPHSSIQKVFEPKEKDSFTDWSISEEIDWDDVTAVYDADLGYYIIYLPIGDSIDSYREFAFDVNGMGWYEWQGINARQGMVRGSGRSIYYASKETNPLTDAVNYLIKKRLYLGSRYESSDNISAIDWSYRTGHEVLGEPSVDKKAIRASIESLGVEAPEEFSVRLRVHSSQHEATTDATKTITSGHRRARFKIRKQRAKDFSFEISGAAKDEKPIFSGIEVEYVTPFKPKIKE